MTPEARRAIEADCTRLVNLYANLNDAGAWDAVAALYAVDGLMSRPSAPDAPVVGRETILATFKSRPARTSQHICTNIVIDVESETQASGFCALLLFTAKDAPPMVGFYRDRFVLTPDGWRFAERRGEMSFA